MRTGPALDAVRARGVRLDVSASHDDAAVAAQRDGGLSAAEGHLVFPFEEHPFAVDGGAREERRPRGAVVLRGGPARIGLFEDEIDHAADGRLVEADQDRLSRVAVLEDQERASS